MIEDINCGQLFQRRSDWQEKAFNELKEDLTATKDNRFLKYQDENETYLVMICGKSQIGKSTLILKMIGIRDENFNDVYDTLRAGSPQGNSSTVTAIIYAKSATDKYALAFAKLDEPMPEKKYYDAKEMARALQQVRQDVESGQRTSTDEILFIDIPRSFFMEESAVGSIRIIDMPGVQSANDRERPHVENLMNAYLPFSQVCIVACNAADIQSLGSMELPGKVSWQNRPERFIVVSTGSYSAENIRSYFRTKRAAREKDFHEYIDEIYARTLKNVLGENTQMELFPVDLGQSLDTMQKSLDEEDAAEVKETVESTLQALRTSITAREGQRFRAAIEDLKSRVDSYESDRLEETERKIREKEGEIRRADVRFRKARDDCKELEKDDMISTLDRKIKQLEWAKSQLEDQTANFRSAGDKLNSIAEDTINQEQLYRDKSDGRYLKDQRCSEKEALADRKVLAAVLRGLKEEVDLYWKTVCETFAQAELAEPAKTDLPILDILEQSRETYYPKYYPGGFFLKVKCTDLERFNCEMAVNVQEMLQSGCCNKWCDEIETELSNLKNQKREQMNLYNKKKSIRDKSLNEQIAPKMQLEALKKQKAAIEMIRQEDSKRLARYLKVAQRHYLQQRDEIVAQMEQSVSGEEKMKLFLLLALTEQDFENLRRTSDGHKS